MFSKLKKELRQLQASPPGKRFQELHERRRAEGRAHNPLTLIVGVVLIIIGIALMVLPGPGILVAAAGLALIAQDLPLFARALDATEARVRRWLGWEKPAAASSPTER